MEFKKEFKYFSILDHEKEQDYLREMHRAGWQFVAVTGLGNYHFRKVEPQDVIYQLDYNQHGLAHKEEYVQMFADCGWEYIQDYAGYSYFRKPAAQQTGEEGIFCDDESRLQMLERVYKGRVLPLVILFSCVLIPQFVINLVGLKNGVLAAVYAVIIIGYLTIFALFARKYYRYRNQVRK